MSGQGMSISGAGSNGAGPSQFQSIVADHLSAAQLGPMDLSTPAGVASLSGILGQILLSGIRV